MKFEHVPYKGASQGLTDLAGGHIVFSVQTVSSAAALVRGGTLRALAHTGKARLPDFPDIPTFKELGYDMVATLWFGLAGPAHLPKDITEKVNAEINRAVQTPEVAARLRRDGLIADPMSVEEFNKFIDAEVATWKPALERAGLLGNNERLGLPDPECQHAALLGRCFRWCRRSRGSGSECRSSVSGSVHSISSTSPAAIRDKQLARLQRRQRAFEPAHVDLGFAHRINRFTVIGRHWTPPPDRVKFPAWLRIPKSSGSRG